MRRMELNAVEAFAWRRVCDREHGGCDNQQGFGELTFSQPCRAAGAHREAAGEATAECA